MAIIDNARPEHAGMPDTLNGEVLLEANTGGLLTCPQKIAYIYMTGTAAHRATGGHDKHQAVYDAMNKNDLTPPTVAEVNELTEKLSEAYLASKALNEAEQAIYRSTAATLRANAGGKALDVAIVDMLQLFTDIANA